MLVGTMRGLLIGISEAVQGQTYQLDQPEISVGRTSSCSLRVPHPSVSREHCSIRVHADRIEIYDPGSHNGTFVNGLPVRERVLLDEDELMIGAVVFLFRTLEPGSGAPVNPGTVEPSPSATVIASNVPLVREAVTLVRIGEVARLVQDLYLNGVALRFRTPPGGGHLRNHSIAPRSTDIVRRRPRGAEVAGGVRCGQPVKRSDNSPRIDR